MPGWADSFSPRVAPRPVTTLKAPGGRPHSAARAANSSKVSGASLDGLATTAFPAARAGAMVRVPIHSGPFQGMMWAVTPIGSRSVYPKNCPGVTKVSPRSLSAMPA